MIDYDLHRYRFGWLVSLAQDIANTCCGSPSISRPGTFHIQGGVVLGAKEDSNLWAVEMFVVLLMILK